MGIARLGRAVASAPLTFAYTFVLLATTVVQRVAPAQTTHQLLAASSTDVAHLGRDPVITLGLSALWLPGRFWLPYAIVLVAFVAPLERRVGSLRTALVFLSGHVLATLLTELPIAVAVLAGWADPDAVHRIDVGASYGMLALVAAYVGGLPRLQGLMVLGLAVVLLAGVSSIGPDMTTYGHALSLVIGVLWWPVLYGRFP